MTTLKMTPLQGSPNHNSGNFPTWGSLPVSNAELAWKNLGTPALSL